MATIELETKKPPREKRVLVRDPSSTKQSRQGGDIVEPAGSQLSWQCKNESDSYLVWFRDYTTNAEAWPFATGADPVPNPPVSGINKYLRVNSKEPRTLTLVNTGSDIVAIKYFALDEKNKDSVEWLDPMIVIRPMTLAASKSTDGVLLGVVCAVLGAAVGAVVAYAML